MSQVSVLKWEVIRQLLGAITGWIPQLLLVLFSFYLIGIIYKLVLAKSLLTFINSVIGYSNAEFSLYLGEKPSEDKKVVKDLPLMKRIFVGALILSIGYYFGYHLNAMYVSGDITLITSVNRVTSFYSLVMWLFEVLLLSLSLFAILGASLRLSSVSAEEFRSTRSYKLINFSLGLFRSVGYLLALVLPIASIIVCYLGIAN